MVRTRTIAAQVNYYDVLEVSPAASPEKIRDSFKRLVLKAHPDKNRDRPDPSEKRMKELIEAFEDVGNAQRRADFDLRLKYRRGSRPREKPFFYYRQDPEARAMLILHHLLKGRPKVAAQLLVEMESRIGSHFLETNLDRPDYLDCLFLLSEHYTASREYALAAEKLRTFYLHEHKARFPRHYLGEVVDRLKDLYLRKLPRFGSVEQAVRGLTQVAALGLTKAEELLRLRRLAEIQAVSGELDEARRWLSHAARLDPNWSGLRKVRKVIEAASQRGD